MSDYLKAMFGTSRNTNPQTKKIIEDLKRSDFKWDKIRRELEREAEEEDRRKRALSNRELSRQIDLEWHTINYTPYVAAAPSTTSNTGYSQMTFSEVMGIWGDEPWSGGPQRAQAVEPEIEDDTEDVVFDDDAGTAGIR